ncbi:MAG: OmpA family protein [Desulfobulbaceae bacterium]|nr:OmpA family protein [Desulfobulbaceae bacterium]
MKKGKLIQVMFTFLILTLVISGCANMSGKQKAFWTGAAAGAVIGGAGGGAIDHNDGYDNNSNDDGIAVGAIAGGLVGGIIGYLTYKEEPLSPPEPEPEPIKVVPQPEPEPETQPRAEAQATPPPPPSPPVKEKIVLRGVNFDFDKSDIKPVFEPVLNEGARILKNRTDVDVVIEGHTCWTGTESYNQKLSERRAKSVRNYLVGKNVDPAQLSTVGYGETRPMADNRKLEGRRMNRRVEFSILD